jgi:23S rRNA (pseudouridine1915-N3)-methyltransferase
VKILKFSDIKEEQWSELQPYLDTCLLPLTGLTGIEGPSEVTQALENLRDVMDVIEQPFTGRVVTYPAIQYVYQHTDFPEIVDQIIINLKKGGFSFVILITAATELEVLEFKEADLFISPETAASKETSISMLVQNMWNNTKAE